MPALTLIVPLQDPGRGLDALVAATAAVIRSGLEVLGVEPVEEMR